MTERSHCSFLSPLLIGALLSTGSACNDAAEGDKPPPKPEERLTEPLPKGEPIDASADEWTWIDFPETRCMDDSATGLGVQMKPDSDEVLIVIQGGGACFNTTSCAGTANPNGFGEDQLAQETVRGLLNDADETNPFRDWNKVFIPYCSGDIFSGTALDGTGFEGRTQAGYLNFRHYLTRLVPTFKDVSRVVLSGYSAGGFAASVNWIQAIEGWGDGVRVDVLNDSGPPMGEKYLTPCLQQRLAEVWHWENNVPEACEECDIAAGHVTEPVMRWSVGYTQQFRHGLISSTDDTIIKLFYGYGQDDCSNLDAVFSVFPEGLYLEGLLDLQDSVFDEHPNARTYLVDSTSHTWTAFQSPGAVHSEGVGLTEWIEDFLDPKSDWENVIPGQ